MIDVIMPRNNHDSVEVLTFKKKKGVYDFTHTKYILYVRINDKKINVSLLDRPISQL